MPCLPHCRRLSSPLPLAATANPTRGPAMGSASADQPAGASPDKLWHVESMSELPSGAGRFSGINVVVIGESLADEEHDLVFPSPEFSADALVSSPKQYREMYERSIKDPAGSWSEIAETFYWKKWNPSEVCSENLDVTKGPVEIPGSKEAKPTYATMLLTATLRLAMGTRLQCNGRAMSPVRMGSSPIQSSWTRFASLPITWSVGVSKGDAVVIYLPMLLELPIAMLTCARIGAVHSIRWPKGSLIASLSLFSLAMW